VTLGSGTKPRARKMAVSKREKQRIVYLIALARQRTTEAGCWGPVNIVAANGLPTRLSTARSDSTNDQTEQT
jgi:hypothetical protein